MYNHTVTRFLLSAGLIFTIGITGCNRHRHVALSSSIGPVADYAIPDYTYEPSIIGENPLGPFDSESVPLPDESQKHLVPPDPNLEPEPKSVSGPSAGLAPLFFRRFQVGERYRARTSGDLSQNPIREDSFGDDTMQRTVVTEPTDVKETFVSRQKLPPRLFSPIDRKMQHMLYSARKRLPGPRAYFPKYREPNR